MLDLQDGRGFLSAIGYATVVPYAYDPEVFTHDLEGDFAQIERAGIRVIVKLRAGHRTLTLAEQAAMIAFLDMELDRDRYAEQTKIRTPAVLPTTGGRAEQAGLNFGDRPLLWPSMSDIVRLSALGLGQRPWNVEEAQYLATADGAVLSRPNVHAEVSTVSFLFFSHSLASHWRASSDGCPCSIRFSLNAAAGGSLDRWGRPI